MRSLRTEALPPRLRATADRIGTKDWRRSLSALLGRMATGADPHHKSLWPRPYQSRRAGVFDGQHERVLLRLERAAGADRYNEGRIDQVVIRWCAHFNACSLSRNIA